MWEKERAKQNEKAGMKKQFKTAVEAICASERIVLASHVNPDGDTLGCILALTHVLRLLNKEVTPLSAA